MANEIYIRTKKINKQIIAKRICCEEDIPKELRNTNIVIYNNTLFVNGKKGCEEAPLGSIIAYMKSNISSTGYFAWPVENPDTDFFEKDGIYYMKSPILKACVVPAPNETRPDWLTNCNINYPNDNTAVIQTLRGFANAKVGFDYLVFHGNSKSGYPKLNIIFRNSKSCNNYILCNENGTDICKLSEVN